MDIMDLMNPVSSLHVAYLAATCRNEIPSLPDVVIKLQINVY